MVNANDVLNLSTLLKMTLSEKEKEDIAQSLSQIIDMISSLETLSLDHVLPIAHPAELTLRCRPDIVRDDSHHHLFTKTSPRFHDGFFVIPRVLDQE